MLAGVAGSAADKQGPQGRGWGRWLTVGPAGRGVGRGVRRGGAGRAAASWAEVGPREGRGRSGLGLLGWAGVGFDFLSIPYSSPF